MKKRYFLLSALMVIGMAAAGCGQGDQGNSTVQTQQAAQTAGEGSDEIQAEAPKTTENEGQTADDQTGDDQTAVRETASGDSQNQASAGGGQTDDGASQTTGQITEQQAKETALADAGYTEDDVTGIRVKQDRDDGREIYEVDFYVQAEEYDYDIDAVTGQILSRDYDIDDDFNNTAPSGVDVISQEEAVNTVLARVEGASADDVRIKLEQDDGRWKYEGEIFYNQMEYEFELNAQTGEILEWSEERA